MQMLAKINAMLQKGWKMTDVTCPTCNGTTMAEPKDQIQTLYCPKQDKQYPFEFEKLAPEEDEQKNQVDLEEEEQRYFDQVTKQINEQKNKQSAINKPTQNKLDDFDRFYLNEKEIQAMKKTNDVSKKIGQKLLQGWTMLNESCNQCYAPIMKSKKGEKICFGCDRDVNAKKEITAPKTQSTPIETKIIQQPKIIESPKEKALKPIPKKSAETKDEKKVVPKILTNNKVESSETGNNARIFSRIEQKSLIFLEDKLENAIQSEDLADIQRVLQLVYKIKNQFK